MNALAALRADAVAGEPGTAQPALRECVARAVRSYLANLRDQPAHALHELVIREVEAPLFAEVMRHFDYNQSRAAQALGLNRATLRKKLREYGLS